MTDLITRMNEAMPWGYQLAFLCRVLVATLCGGAIGFERTKRLKEAGIRTHCLVCCASALIMIVSKYAFADLSVDGAFFSGDRGADRNGSTLKGLTTAAGVWATAGIGLAIGAGMYPIGIATTIIIILMQSIMHKFNIGNDALATRDINITMKDTPELRDAFLAELRKMEVSVIGSHITHNGDGTVNYGLTIKFNREISFEEILAFMDAHPDVRNIAL